MGLDSGSADPRKEQVPTVGRPIEDDVVCIVLDEEGLSSSVDGEQEDVARRRDSLRRGVIGDGEPVG